MITGLFSPSGASEAVSRAKAPRRQGGGITVLTVFALAALICHILIYHACASFQPFDDHRSPLMQDVETCSESAEDGDTCLVHGHRGVSHPLLSPDAGVLAEIRIRTLLLIAADEHPPKA